MRVLICGSEISLRCFSGIQDVLTPASDRSRTLRQGPRIQQTPCRLRLPLQCVLPCQAWGGFCQPNALFIDNSETEICVSLGTTQENSVVEAVEYLWTARYVNQQSTLSFLFSSSDMSCMYTSGSAPKRGGLGRDAQCDLIAMLHFVYEIKNYKTQVLLLQVPKSYLGIIPYLITTMGTILFAVSLCLSMLYTIISLLVFDTLLFLKMMYTSVLLLNQITRNKEM